MLWHNERRKVSELKDHPKNPRLITERGAAALAKSIERNGYADAICVNTDGTILSGHARRKQLSQLGFEEIDVRVPERMLNEDEQRLYMIEANKAIAGEFDFEILANEFEIEELKEVGFTDVELGISAHEKSVVQDTNEWAIVISFPGENETRQLFEELQKRGYECKIMR